MDYFGLDEQVAALEAQLEHVAGGERLAVLVPLAWYLRERDTRRALLLVAEARSLVPVARGLESAERTRVEARLTTIDAAAKVLFAQYDAAELLIASARRGFESIADLVGVGDTCVLEARVMRDRGQREDACLQAAHDNHRQTGDVIRWRYAQVWLAIRSTYSDINAAERQWGEAVAAARKLGHPGLDANCEFFQALIHGKRGESSRSILVYQRAVQAALVSGQMRLATVLLHNVGVYYEDLQAYAEALEWAERAMALCKDRGWPCERAVCLSLSASVLCALGRHATAKAQLQEARAVLENTGALGVYLFIVWVLGDLSQDIGEYDEALRWHTELERLARDMGRLDMVYPSLTKQATALSRLGRIEEALTTAERSLAHATEADDRDEQYKALLAHAEIARSRGLPAPAGAEAANGAIHYQQRALAVAAQIDGFVVESRVLSELARDHEAAGELRQALACERQAAESKDKTHSKRASDQASVMQVRFETDRLTAEAEHHKALAAVEARRAQALTESNTTLERLAAIGHQITAGLEAEAVFEAMHRHVGSMLDALSVSIWLVEGDELVLRFGMEGARVLPRVRIALDHANAHVARCAREEREILLEPTAGEHCASIDGTLPMLTALFAPLSANGRTLGVLSIQSAREHAYGARELQVCRTLAAYGAVAFANAAANRELERLARQDGLTGLANRSAFDEALLREVERARRYGAGLSLIMGDVDHFKAYNDRYGHIAGDHCLQQVAQVLQGTCRTGSDMAARYGGEEFALILPETDAAGAAAAAERLRAHLARLQLPHAGSATAAHVTISLGAVTFAGDADIAPGELLERADQALYHSKRSGRDRFTHHAQLLLREAG